MGSHMMVPIYFTWTICGVAFLMMAGALRISTMSGPQGALIVVNAAMSIAPGILLQQQTVLMSFTAADRPHLIAVHAFTPASSSEKQ